MSQVLYTNTEINIDWDNLIKRNIFLSLLGNSEMPNAENRHLENCFALRWYLHACIRIIPTVENVC